MLPSGRASIYGRSVRLRNRTDTLATARAARNAGTPVATGQMTSADSNDVGTCEASHHDRLTAYTASKNVPKATALDVRKAAAPGRSADRASSARRWKQKIATATRKIPTLMDA